MPGQEAVVYIMAVGSVKHLPPVPQGAARLSVDVVIRCSTLKPTTQDIIRMNGATPWRSH